MVTDSMVHCTMYQCFSPSYKSLSLFALLPRMVASCCSGFFSPWSPQLCLHCHHSVLHKMISILFYLFTLLTSISMTTVSVIAEDHHFRGVVGQFICINTFRNQGQTSTISDDPNSFVGQFRGVALGRKHPRFQNPSVS
jgi:hypothetical protein